MTKHLNFYLKTIKMKKIDNQKRGTKSRASGLRFERKVRKNLEENGWIICKWANNVELSGDNIQDKKQIPYGMKFKFQGKIIPAKNKFNPFSKAMMLGSGFPDFIAFQDCDTNYNKRIIGVEAKSNGILNKEEKLKCQWYLKNNIFSKILIASKSKERGKIDYKKFKTKEFRGKLKE